VFVGSGSHDARDGRRCAGHGVGGAHVGLRVGNDGVHRVQGQRPIDYRDARARATIGTFSTGYLRMACPRGVAVKVIARTADVAVGYPHVDWSASLSSSVFLVARTPRGLVAWAQMH
jgi:hypothetical protein